MKKFILIAALCAITNVLSAQIKLPHIFGDNMVLQREKPITVWGWAKAKEKVTINFHDQTKTTVADKAGKWSVKLDSEKAGGPYTLIVSGKNSVTLTNILVGEVWICSGQSNMEWPVRMASNAAQEIAEANYPQIRHIKIPNVVASTPQADFASGDWKVCSPETAGDFTAVGYFFAVKLAKELNVPVGLINTSWGGTHSETWTSREAFQNSDEFKSMIASVPVLNLDEINKKRTAENALRLEALQGKVTVTQQEVERWKSPDDDDAAWPVMQIPALWEESVFPGLDGIVWLRKTFSVSPADAGRAAELYLGMIDDSDETYVNGVKVGGLTAQYNTPRVYTIREGLLKAGRNVISVRVTDTGGGGGIYGPADQVKITIGDRTESLAGTWKLRVENMTSTGSIGPNDYPTLLFNAMLNPLIPFTIQGAIWYQGESNAGRAFQYRKAFPLMITDWRKHWGQGDFPFYFVQLSSFNDRNGNSNAGSAWAELREAQAMTLKLPNTGMAVTTDVGEANDIHPRNKKDVGYRLAAIALTDTYRQNLQSRGPAFDALTIRGAEAFVSFKHIGSGLVTPDKYGYLRGFELAGDDRKFYPAQAFIQEGQVIVRSAAVTKPVAVRYNWMDVALEGNLFNREGFPAEPFRTDNWKGVTEEAKFSVQ